MYDSGQVKSLGKSKDGKPDGPYTSWHENGQKKWETTLKDGKPDDLKTWTITGEEVETVVEAIFK